MSEKSHVEDEVRELFEKDEDDRTGEMGEKEILELMTKHPELQRYVDRRVSEGVKTYAANQKKKAERKVEEAQEDKAGAEQGGGLSGSPDAQEDDKKQEPDFQKLSEMTAEAERIQNGRAIEQELANRGLDCFAGLVQDPSMIDDLEKAAFEFLRSQNLGADFAPQQSPAPAVSLSPFEALVAARLGISLEQYEKHKRELENKEGLS